MSENSHNLKSLFNDNRVNIKGNVNMSMLVEDIYVEQPLGFVCIGEMRLNRVIYSGIKWGSIVWIL
jgi:hypothetical protein